MRRESPYGLHPNGLRRRSRSAVVHQFKLRCKSILDGVLRVQTTDDLSSSDCWDLSDVIKIRVKQDGRTEEFSMSRPLLRWHSAYFNAALDPDGGFVERGQEVFEIEEDIEAFETFRSWMFTTTLGDAPSPAQNGGAATAQTTQTGTSARTNMRVKYCKAWILGESRGVPGLKNAVIDALHKDDWNNWALSVKEMSYVYNNTMPNAALRRYLTEFISRTMAIKEVAALSAEKKQRIPRELIWDLIGLWSKRTTVISRKTWASQDRCQWHDHDFECGPSGPGGSLRLRNRRI